MGSKEEAGEQQQWFGQEKKWAGPRGQQERRRKVGLGDISREPRAGVSDGLEMGWRSIRNPACILWGSGGGAPIEGEIQGCVQVWASTLAQHYRWLV